MENEIEDLELKKPNELKDSEELHERFVQIFSDVDKNNPINIDIDKEAWPIFLKIVENYSHTDLMRETDADLVKKCISVQEIYFEQRNIITDGNGNPNISANIKANPNFIKENPEVLEVLGNIPIDRKIEILMQEESIDKFLDIFYSLSPEERDIAKNEILSNLEKRATKEQENVDSNNISDKDIDNATFLKLKKLSEKNFYELSDEEQAELLKLCLYLSVSKTPNMKIAVRLILTGIIPEEELRLMDHNHEKFVENMLARISAKINGNITNYEEIVQTVRDSIISEIKQNNLKTNISEKDKEEFKRNFEDIKVYQEKDLSEEFTEVNQLTIYESFKKSRSLVPYDNAAIVGLYVLLQEKEKNNAMTEKEKDLKEVLEKVIFSENYITRFGHYRNGQEINLEEVKSFMEKCSRDFDRYSSQILEKVNSGSVNANDFEYHRTVMSISTKKVVEPHFEIEDSILKEYLMLKEKYDNIDDQVDKRITEHDIKKIESNLALKIQYSKFMTKGSLDLEKIQSYLNNKEEEKEPRKELLEKLLDLRESENTNLYKGKKADLVKFVRESKDFSNIAGRDLSDEDVFHNIENVYEEEISKYMDKKAFYTLYHEYANGREFVKLNFSEKRIYLQSLIIAHSSENQSIREFSDKFIRKLNSSGIDLIDSDGEISDDKLVKLYSTYTSTSIISIEDIGKIKTGTKGLKKSQFDKDIIKNSKARLEYLEIDSENIQAISDSIDLTEGKKEEIFLGKEYYDALKQLNLENTYNVINIVCMYNELLNNEKRNDNQTLVMSMIGKFITSDENRIYFAEVLCGDRLKESIVKKYKAITKTKTGVGEYGNHALTKLATNKEFENPTGREDDEDSIVGKFTKRMAEMNTANEKKTFIDIVTMFGNIDIEKIPQKNLDEMIRKRNLDMFLKEDGSGADLNRIARFREIFYIQNCKKNDVQKNIKDKVDKLYELMNQEGLKIEFNDDTFKKILQLEVAEKTVPITDDEVKKIMESSSVEIKNEPQKSIAKNNENTPISDAEIMNSGKVEEMDTSEINRDIGKESEVENNSLEDKKEGETAAHHDTAIVEEIRTDEMANGRKEDQQEVEDYGEDIVPEEKKEIAEEKKSILSRIANMANRAIESLRGGNNPLEKSSEENGLIEYNEKKGLFSGLMKIIKNSKNKPKNETKTETIMEENMESTAETSENYNFKDPKFINNSTNKFNDEVKNDSIVISENKKNAETEISSKSFSDKYAAKVDHKKAQEDKKNTNLNTHGNNSVYMEEAVGDGR